MTTENFFKRVELAEQLKLTYIVFLWIHNLVKSQIPPKTFVGTPYLFIDCATKMVMHHIQTFQSQFCTVHTVVF